MSYILEALKKSERERKLGTVPHLGTPQEVPPPRQVRARSRSWLVPVLLINAVLLLGLLGYLVVDPSAPGFRWQMNRENQVNEETIARGGAMDKPSAPAATAEAQPPAGSELSTDLAPSSTATADSPTQPAETEEWPGTPGAGSPETGSFEAEAPSSPEAAPKAAADLRTGPAPRLSELPGEFQRQVVLPTLEVHVYSENPARRFIMIGGRQYQEGDRLPEELRLEEITPTGVVLSRQGQHFRLDR